MEKETGNPMIYVCVPTTEERRPRLQKLIDSVRKSDYPNLTLVIHEGKHPGCVESIHALVEGLGDNTMCMWLSDDNTIEPDTISRLWEAHQKTFEGAWGYAQSYNEIQGATLITAGLCQAGMVKRYFYKGYIHNYSDNEFTEVVDSLCMHVYVPEAIVHHEHVSAMRPDLQDETYESNQMSKEQDRQLWLKRKANNYLPKNE